MKLFHVLLIFLLANVAEAADKVTIKLFTSFTGKSGKLVVTSCDVSFPVVTSGGVARVQVGDISYGDRMIPSRALWAELKQSPKSNLFRVSWTSETHIYEFYSTALYNRKQHTLKFCSFSTYSGWSRALVTNVTDKAIESLANFDEVNASPSSQIPDVEDGGFTAFLEKYGVRVVKSQLNTEH